MPVLYYAVELIVLVALVYFFVAMYKVKAAKQAANQKESERLAERKAALAALQEAAIELTQTIEVTTELKETEKAVKDAEEKLHSIEGTPI